MVCCFFRFTAKAGVPCSAVFRYFTSAKTGEGLEELRNAVTEFFTRVEKKFELVIPYSDGKKLSYLHDNGTILEEEYRGDGVYVKGRIPRELWIFGE